MLHPAAMSSEYAALHFLLLAFSGWVNRQQQNVIDYLVAENRVLREQLGDRRLHLNDDQRRRLAVKGKALGRKVLGEVACIVTPDTILRWYRKLVARKYDGSAKRGPGRPRTRQETVVLVIQIATENPTYGYTKIRGALRNLGINLGRNTIKRILRIIPLGEKHLRRSIREYVLYYRIERPHQGLGNELIEPDETAGRVVGEIKCRERLGGLLRYYYRDAA